MEWLDGWVRDMAYMMTGIVMAFLLSILYTVFQIVSDWMQRRYVQQTKQPQKVDGKVKQPMGFL